MDLVKAARKGRTDSWHYSMALTQSFVPGFQATGRIHDNLVEFEIFGEQFRVQCSEPVAPGIDQTLYVRYKPDPELHQSEFFAGVPQ